MKAYLKLRNINTQRHKCAQQYRKQYIMNNL